MGDFHWTFGSWLMFLLYIFASVSGWRLAEIVRRTIGYRTLRERTIWQMESILVLTLAANTAVNGLGRLTALFRTTAMAVAWYANRAPIQTHFIGLLLGAFVITAALAPDWPSTLPRPC